MNRKLLASLVVVSIVLTLVFAYVAINRNLTPLENVLLQMISLAIGLVASGFYGRQSIQDAAKEVIKPHAKSAFRRLISLYQSLWRLSAAIQTAKLESDRRMVNVNVLDKFDAVVTEQLSTATDALEDWRDIVPEDVEALYSQMGAGENRRQNHE